MTGASKATATRNLSDLAAAGLVRTTGQGKATRYVVNVPRWTHGSLTARGERPLDPITLPGAGRDDA